MGVPCALEKSVFSVAFRGNFLRLSARSIWSNMLLRPIFPYFLSSRPVHLLTSEGPNLKVVTFESLIFFEYYLIFSCYFICLLCISYPPPYSLRSKFMEKGPCLLVTTVTLQTMTDPRAQQICVRLMNYSSYCSSSNLTCFPTLPWLCTCWTLHLENPFPPFFFFCNSPISLPDFILCCSECRAKWVF